MFPGMGVGHCTVRSKLNKSEHVGGGLGTLYRGQGQGSVQEPPANRQNNRKTDIQTDMSEIITFATSLKRGNKSHS